MTKSVRVLKSTKAVMKALGGTQTVANLTRRDYKAAFNWLGSPTFPSNTFVVMTGELKAQRLSAPASLWAMTEAPRTPERVG